MLDPTIQLFLMKNTPDDPLYWFWKKYPGLSESELQEVEEMLEGYAETALRIFERISKDPAAWAEFEAELKKLKKQEKRGK
jgi:hypothetical protein